MIVATAPGRCGLVGNPTDMYGGSVISCSTKERARCSLQSNTADFAVTVAGQNLVLKTSDDLELRNDYFDIIRAVLAALEVDPTTSKPFHLVAETDIPMQAGLAGSTAILAAVTGCVLAELEITLNRYEIAELIRKIEYDVLQIVCGFQDHYMTVFGGLNFMDFRDKNSASPGDELIPFATVEPLQGYLPEQFPFVLAHTGVRHHSGSVHKSPRERWLAGEKSVVDGYLEIGRFARDAKRALLTCDWPVFGDLMNRNHAIVRGLGGSGDANEKLITAALNSGAIGAKLAGAGGGGTILALSDDLHKTSHALLEAGAEQLLTPIPSPGLIIDVNL